MMAPTGGNMISLAISTILLALSIIIMLIWSTVPLLWIVATFVLYSFNYIVFFLPISRHPGVENKKKEPSPKRSIKGPLRYLLKKKRKFALEVGATMFLVGLVPLARSFFVLFGVGLVLTVYYGVLQSVYPFELTIGLCIQILVIMGYFVLVVTVSPQSQGFTRIARSFKFRILTARSKGRPAYIWAMTISGFILVVVSLLAIGAILLPGRTMGAVIEFFKTNGSVPLLLFAAILLTEFYVMRSIQSRGSRRMVIALIEQKLQELRTDCLEPLDAIITEAGSRNLTFIDYQRYQEVLYTFYPLAFYDVVETNLFGYSPVYLVIPKIDLLLDEQVLQYVGVAHDLDGKPILKESESPRAGT